MFREFGWEEGFFCGHKDHALLAPVFLAGLEFGGLPQDRPAGNNFIKSM
jgi:hypothetical protein